MLQYHASEYRLGVHNRLFRCDVEIAARILPPETQEMWRWFHVLGTPNGECRARLEHMNRGDFFRHVYTLERDLGRELMRRGISPVSEYFCSTP